MYYETKSSFCTMDIKWFLYFCTFEKRVLQFFCVFHRFSFETARPNRDKKGTSREILRWRKGYPADFPYFFPVLPYLTFQCSNIFFFKKEIIRFRRDMQNIVNTDSLSFCWRNPDSKSRKSSGNFALKRCLIMKKKMKKK